MFRRWSEMDSRRALIWDTDGGDANIVSFGIGPS